MSWILSDTALVNMMTTTPPISGAQRSQEISNDLDNSIKYHIKYAKRNYAFALFLAFVLIFSSVFGAIGGVFSKLSIEYVGLLAAVPTVVAFISSVYAPQQRANWHFTKSVRLKSLKRRVLYEIDPNNTLNDVKSVSAAWSAIEEEMEIIWKDSLILGLDRSGDKSGANSIPQNVKPQQATS